MSEKIPEITKRNFQKILRELEFSTYPSLFEDVYIKNIKIKLDNKEPLGFLEKQLSFHRVKNYFENYRKQIGRFLVSQLDFSKFKNRPPLDFQEVGVKFLLSDERCILADDTGIGKSIQSVIAAMCLPEEHKILIVTLKTLKYNFQHEISYYCDSYKVIEDNTWETGYKFTIIHYQQLKKYKAEILKEKFDCVIADECHVLTNTKTKRTKSFIDVIEEKNNKISKLWLLTGTPIINKPVNYFPLLKLIKHPLAKNWVSFVERYCDGHKNFFDQWVVGGASNQKELHEKTKGSILRRLKIDHIKDLPNKNRVPIFLKLNNIKGYDHVVAKYEEKKIKELKENAEFDFDGFETSAITELLLKRQFCALEKIRDGSLIELINNEIEKGNKLVIFSNFTEVLDAVYNHFTDKTFRLVDGRIKNPLDRLKIIEEFNNDDDLKGLCLNTAVGSTGLNIPSANVSITNDLYWSPSIMVQGEDRLWRIGQTREVNNMYPIYEGTVEEVVYNVVQEKTKNISTIVDGKEVEYFKTDKAEDTKNKSILQLIFDQLKIA